NNNPILEQVLRTVEQRRSERHFGVNAPRIHPSVGNRVCHPRSIKGPTNIEGFSFDEIEGALRCNLDKVSCFIKRSHPSCSRGVKQPLHVSDWRNYNRLPENKPVGEYQLDQIRSAEVVPEDQVIIWVTYCHVR